MLHILCCANCFRLWSYWCRSDECCIDCIVLNVSGFGHIGAIVMNIASVDHVSSLNSTFDCIVLTVSGFDHISSVKQHITQHADAQGHYACNFCEKSFEDYHSIRKHMRSFHSDKQYICAECNKVSTLSVHLTGVSLSAIGFFFFFLSFFFV